MGLGTQAPSLYSASFPKCYPQKVRGGSPSRGLSLHRVGGGRAGEATPFFWGSAWQLPISLLLSTLGLTFVIRPACSCCIWDGQEPDRNSEVLSSKEKENINLGDKTH